MAHVFETSGHASDGNYSYVPGISALFGSRRPSAVSRIVIAVIVWVSIYGSAGGALSHIGQESGKVSPLVADGYAPATVIHKLGRIRVGAPLDHCSPGPVCSGPLTSSLAVDCPIRMVLLQTSTGFSVSVSKIRIPDWNRFAAVAQAKTNGSTLSGRKPFGWKILNYEKPSKFITFERLSVPGHNGSFVVFSGGSQSEFCGSLQLSHGEKELQG